MLPPKSTKKGPATTAPQPSEIDAARALAREALGSSLSHFAESQPDVAGALLIAEAIHLQTTAIQKAERHLLGAIRDQTWVMREQAAHLSRYESLLTSIVENQRRILEKGVKR